jgi:hypothetical protein
VSPRNLLITNTHMNNVQQETRLARQSFLDAPSGILYSLAVIYRRDLREIWSWYGIDLNATIADMKLNLPPNRPSFCKAPRWCECPSDWDSAFDPNRTNHLGRMVEQWGLVPLAYLAQFASDKYTYCYVGREDFTMYPILPPGTFFKWTNRKTRFCKACGVPNTSGPFISWKPATATLAAGAR